MSLNRSAEALAPGPRGAAAARRWVAAVCAEIGRDDLSETAELALSEVVTNAILHGSPPVLLRLRGTVDHPRVEVRDSSPEPPKLESDEPDLDDLDLFDEVPTFGRGLSIVARLSEAWGADRDGDGKLVWFVPRPAPVDDAVPGVLLGWEDDDDAPFVHERTITITLRNVPVDALHNTMTHSADLRRELRLLALAHQESYPLATDLSEFFTALARDFRDQLGRPLHEALDAGRERVDLEIAAPPDSEERFTRLCELLDLADVFCRHERLLTLARTPEQEAFQDWLFGEMASQAAGHAPTEWSPSAVSSFLPRAQP